jgi:hypothetical protein
MSAVAATTDASVAAGRLVRGPATANRLRPSGPDAIEDLPPPPVAVIRRRPTASELGAEHRPGRRGTLRSDGPAGSATNPAVRSAIDQVLEDLADERDRTKR